MADRIGRRKVFIATALNVALATGIMALTPDRDGWIFLSVFRFFVGFGNAGLIAVDIPLVQEFVPSRKRGWVSGLTTTLLPAGNLLGALCGAVSIETITPECSDVDASNASAERARVEPVRTRTAESSKRVMTVSSHLSFNRRG